MLCVPPSGVVSGTDAKGAWAMIWYFTIVAVLVLGGVAAVAAGRGGVMGEVERPSGHRLPEGRLGSEDLRRARFGMAVRGYRMDEVDALLDRLAAQMERDADGQEPPPTAGS